MTIGLGVAVGEETGVGVGEGVAGTMTVTFLEAEPAELVALILTV